MPVFPLMQGHDSTALIRPLTTDDRQDLEAIIASNPLAFLYAAEHLEHFGLPTPSALNTYRAQHGFMGIFVPRRETNPLANTGIADGGTAETFPPKLKQQTLAEEGFSRRVRAATDSLLTPISQLIGGRRKFNRDARDPRLKATLPGETEVFTRSHPLLPKLHLVGVFWLGANCVPLVLPEEYLRQAATVIGKSAKTIASLFGEAEKVLPLWELLRHKLGKPLSVRENQPLLYLPPGHHLGEFTSQKLYRAQLRAPQLELDGVRWARTSDRSSLLKASVAMFTEEVGYNPLSRDPTGYARRVDQLIRTGRSAVATNQEGIVVFKTDIGLAHADTCQIQGVWLHPAYRGLGLSEPLLAQAVELIRPRFPQVSLYVNDYNHRARKLYASLGMRQRGRFATVLF